MPESSLGWPESHSFTHDKITITYVDGEEETTEMALDDPMWEKATSAIEEFCNEMGWDFLSCVNFRFEGVIDNGKENIQEG